jgi:hypothetical protein
VGVLYASGIIGRYQAMNTPMGGDLRMKMKIVSGFAAATLGAALAMALGTHAQAAAPANYSQACKEIVASSGLAEKAVIVGVVRFAAPDSPLPPLLSSED